MTNVEKLKRRLMRLDPPGKLRLVADQLEEAHKRGCSEAHLGMLYIVHEVLVGAASGINSAITRYVTEKSTRGEMP